MAEPIDDKVMISYADLMQLVQSVRGYQAQIEQLTSSSHWGDDAIDRIKHETGLHFGDDSA